MDPLIGSSLISAGSSLLGGIFGRSSKRKAARAARAQEERNWARTLQLRNEQWARDDRAFQRTVADAQAAGLHPLFALGAGMPSGGGGAVYSSPSIYESETGSFAGDAFQAISDGFSTYQAGKRLAAEERRDERLTNAQIRSAEARAHRDEAEALAAMSEVARATQAANHTRGGDQVTVHKLSPPPVFSARPIEAMPRESHVAYVDAVGPQGPDHYRYAPPGLGGDEINQGIWAINRAVEHTRDVFSDLLLGIRRSLTEEAPWERQLSPTRRK